jgi:hypothetical protein
MSKRKIRGIIDFHVRPPLVPFKILFDLIARRLTWENKFNIGLPDNVAPSVYKATIKEGPSGLKQLVLPAEPRKPLSISVLILTSGDRTYRRKADAVSDRDKC